MAEVAGRVSSRSGIRSRVRCARDGVLFAAPLLRALTAHGLRQLARLACSTKPTEEELSARIFLCVVANLLGQQPFRFSRMKAGQRADSRPSSRAWCRGKLCFAQTSPGALRHAGRFAAGNRVRTGSVDGERVRGECNEREEESHRDFLTDKRRRFNRR